MTGHEWSAVDDVAKALGFKDSEALGVGYCSTLSYAGVSALHTLARLIREVRNDPKCHETVIHLLNHKNPGNFGGVRNGLCGARDGRLSFVTTDKPSVTCATCLAETPGDGVAR